MHTVSHLFSLFLLLCSIYQGTVAYQLLCYQNGVRLIVNAESSRIRVLSTIGLETERKVCIPAKEVGSSFCSQSKVITNRVGPTCSEVGGVHVRVAAWREDGFDPDKEKSGIPEGGRQHLRQVALHHSFR